MEKNNYNVKSLEEQIADLSEIKVGSLNNAISELRRLDNALGGMLAEAQRGVADPELGGIYIILTTLLAAESANISSQISSLDSQVDSLKSSKETGENSLRNGIDQIVKGAETLYIGIATMEAGIGSIERALQTLDRAIAIYEKQYELGMASLYDLESMRYQRSSAVSSLRGLLFQIKTSKITLEGLCGLPLTGTTRLAQLPVPEKSLVESVDYEKDLRKGLTNNVDVKNAKVQEKNDTSDANRFALQAAEDTFSYNFKNVCLTVGEKQRLVEAAEETLSFQQRTFEITAKKYELGMVSEEEYLAGESDLRQAEGDLTVARLDLFSAYNAYTWARDYGII